MHRELRARLDAITSSPESGRAEPDLLRSSCLSFCRSLRRHHVGETDAAFEVVRRHAPELDDAINMLVQDHEFLDPMLDHIEAMMADLDAVPDGALQRELDGVAAVLANHLAYEERVLVDVLDRLSARSGSEEDRALRAPLEGMFDADWGAGHASYRPACQGDGFHGLWRTPRDELENGMPVVHRSCKAR